jgi:hypothetical protein
VHAESCTKSDDERRSNWKEKRSLERVGWTIEHILRAWSIRQWNERARLIKNEVIKMSVHIYIYKCLYLSRKRKNDLKKTERSIPQYQQEKSSGLTPRGFVCRRWSRKLKFWLLINSWLRILLARDNKIMSKVDASTRFDRARRRQWAGSERSLPLVSSDNSASYVRTCAPAVAGRAGVRQSCGWDLTLTHQLR